MKFQNLLGMFAVLLIALSGPSYASGHGSPPPSPVSPIPSTSPPSPPTTFIPPPIITFVPSAADIIDPTVSEPEGTESNEVTESNCGGSVELCKNKGKSEGDELAKFTIERIVEMELLEAKDKKKTIVNLPAVLELFTSDGGLDLAGLLMLVVRNPLAVLSVSLNGPEKVLTKLAARRAELALRTIKERLLTSAENPNCDANCKAYNEAKAVSVDDFHEGLVKALNDADIPLLEIRIAG